MEEAVAVKSIDTRNLTPEDVEKDEKKALALAVSGKLSLLVKDDPRFAYVLARNKKTADIMSRDPNIKLILERAPKLVEMLANNPETAYNLAKNKDLFDIIKSRPGLKALLQRYPKAKAALQSHPDPRVRSFAKELGFSGDTFDKKADDAARRQEEEDARRLEQEEKTTAEKALQLQHEHRIRFYSSVWLTIALVFFLALFLRTKVPFIKKHFFWLAFLTLLLAAASALMYFFDFLKLD